MSPAHNIAAQDTIVKGRQWFEGETSAVVARVIKALPKPKKVSGGRTTEQDFIDISEAVHKIVRYLLDDSNFISPTLMSLESRVVRRDSMGLAHKDNCWANVTTLGALEIDWVMTWIETKTDVSLCVLRSMAEADEFGIYLLLVRITQLPLSLKLPDAMRNQQVAWAVLDYYFLGQECARPLENGWVSNDGVLDAKKISVYNFGYTGEVLSSIGWKSTGDKVTLGESCITKKWDLINSSRHITARFQFGNMQPQNIYSLFRRAKTGPCAKSAKAVMGGARTLRFGKKSRSSNTLGKQMLWTSSSQVKKSRDRVYR